ncbi:MAG TPA: hypothetical protein VGD92_07375 [Sphingobacteriaceae bacterium]
MTAHQIRSGVFLSLFLSLVLACLGGCSDRLRPGTNAPDLDRLAERYVRIGLQIGQYDPDFVDAYYGPDSLKPAGEPLKEFPKEALTDSVNALLSALKPYIAEGAADSVKQRASWISDQLVAFRRRIRIFSGDHDTFDAEAAELFGVRPPAYPEVHYQKLLSQMDSVLPGKGDIQQRFQELADRFVIPADRLDTVLRTTIAESRARTMRHYPLPAGENFSLAYVTDKPWSGYNWYKGDFRSEIQINTDVRIFIDRAIDVGCHESYPGHHVYNALLEKNLYRNRGYVEISLYPLFSPQSLIAEGSANFGIDVVFPGSEKTAFTRDRLLPLAGMDTTGIDRYFKALEIRGRLNYARNEAARGLLDNTMTESQAVQYLMKYCLYNQETAEKSVSFIKKYRSYVINYNYGQDLVRQYIESRGGTAADPEKRWKVFGELLSQEIRTRQLAAGRE